MAIPDGQWPSAECAPDDNHVMSLAAMRELGEAIVTDGHAMDRLRMNRIGWFRFIGDLNTVAILVRATAADITDPEPAEEPLTLGQLLGKEDDQC